MLSQAQRTTILELNAQGVSRREIARVLGISRVAVRKILRSNSTNLPELHRAEKAEPHRRQILELLGQCKGNLVRVHEELVVSGAALSYQALTAFCRRHGIGQAPPAAAGQYHFEPGEEMQHDTSPHEVELGGKKRKVQTASAVLCYSRMLFFQCYPTFQRFDCKVFLTDALRYFSGASERVMIDNTHVVVLRGTGREMVAVPEMVAFAERFAPPPSDALYQVRYRIPNALRDGLRGASVAIVNDVTNAGSAVRGTYEDLVACGARPVALGTLVAFGEWSTSFANEHGLALEALERLGNNLWTPQQCPLCAAGEPLQDPSREQPL